jgi:hypothetical protein
MKVVLVKDSGSVNLQSSSPKRKARHSLIKDLGLDRVAKLTPRKKKLYTEFGECALQTWEEVRDKENEEGLSIGQ